MRVSAAAGRAFYGPAVLRAPRSDPYRRVDTASTLSRYADACDLRRFLLPADVIDLPCVAMRSLGSRGLMPEQGLPSELTDGRKASIQFRVNAFGGSGMTWSGLEFFVGRIL